MSSLTRSIQKGAKSPSPFNGRGSKLGVHSVDDESLLARLARENGRKPS